MLCTILKPFPYSTDGVTHRDLVVDDVEDLAVRMVPGLEAEGYVLRIKDDTAPVLAVSIAEGVSSEDLTSRIAHDTTISTGARKSRRGNR